MDGIQTVISLILKALILSARWVGMVRIRQMGNFAGEDDNLNLEILYLRDRIYQLETELEICRKHGKNTNRKPRYTLRERWLILWYKEYFQVSTRKITNRLGVARSTIF